MNYRSAYEKDGYVVVPGLYEASEMLRWKKVIQEALQAERFNDPSGVRVWMANQFVPGLLDAMVGPKISPILHDILGPDVEFLSAKAVFKNGATRFASPWHQDWFYWSGSTKLSVWIAMDDARIDNGCLKIIPATHHKIFDKVKTQEKIGFDNRISDEDLAGLPVVSLECKRGDAVFFHDLLVHASHPNVSGGDRWSFISTYRNSSIEDDSKIWSSSVLLGGRGRG